MAVSNELPFIGLVRTSSRPRSHRDQNAKDPNHKDQQNANPTQGSWLESVLVRFRSTRKAPGTCRRTEQHRTTFPSYSWEGHSTVLKRKKQKKKKTNRGGGQSHISCQSCHGCPTKQTPPTDNQHRAKNPDDISPCDVNVSPTQSFLNVRS